MLCSSLILPVLAVVAAALPQNAESYANRKSGTQQASLKVGSKDYRVNVLYHHNRARKHHGTANLTYDVNLEVAARKCAERCEWKHYVEYGSGHGQNIYANSFKTDNSTAAITESWYKKEYYNYTTWDRSEPVPRPLFEAMGHLTQMIWKSTQKVGCWSTTCPGGIIMPKGQNFTHFTACNYYPAGNVVGSFNAQLGKPLRDGQNIYSWKWYD